MPRSRKVSCIRAYSPLRTIFEPFSVVLLRARGRVVGGPVAVGQLLAELVEDRGDVVGDVAEVAALDAHRQVDRRLDVDVGDLGRDRRSG